MLEDAQLLREYVDNHSQSAFTALVERYGGLVYHAALRRLGDSAFAQNVFVILAQNREAILLRYFQARSAAEIAEANSISKEASYKRVERAVGRLRLALARRGITSTAAVLSATLAAEGAASTPPGLTVGVAGVATAAASTIASSWGVLYFMTTTKTITAITSGLAVALVAGSIYERNQSQRAQSELSSITQERDQMRDRLVEAEQLRSQPLALRGRHRQPARLRGGEVTIRSTEGRPTQARNTALAKP
jgi:hypothetical protein